MKFLLVSIILVFTFNTEIEIEDSWIRPAAEGMNSALYFTIINNSEQPDTLYKVESDVAETVEIHETFTTENDMMGMREAGDIIIEPNSKFTFKPKAHHVMLMNLKQDLKKGSKVKVAFYFKEAGEIELVIPVMDNY